MIKAGDQPHTGDGYTRGGRIPGRMIQFLAGHNDRGQGNRGSRLRPSGDIPYDGKHRR